MLGGEPSGDSQFLAMTELGRYVGDRPQTPAPPVRILPEQIELSSVDRSATGFAFGLRDFDLGPAVFEFEPGGFIVVGPPRSGKTTALITIAECAPPTIKGIIIVASHPSRLTMPRPDRQTAVGAEEGRNCSVALQRALIATSW